MHSFSCSRETHSRLRPASVRIFPGPLSRLCSGHKRSLVVGTHHARVVSDIGNFQERFRALVGSNGLEVTERIAHEVNGSTL